MKPIFLALLHQLQITDDLGTGDKIGEELRVTNNRNVIGELIKPAFRTIIGDMEVSSLLEGMPVVFAQEAIPDDLTPQEYLLARLYELQSFLMSTWVIQDNAINCELGFLLFHRGQSQTATSNFVAHLYSTADGKKEITKLTREQFRAMRGLHHAEIRIPDRPFAMPVSRLTPSHARLSRSHLFINAARGEFDVAMKIAHYCTAFETLFATTQTELSHQLSERIACYLFDTPEERLATYRKIKQAYGVRSKVVHGSTVRDNKLDELIETSQYCDQIARQIFMKLLTQADARALFDKSTEVFDEEMLKTIFSGKA